MAAEFKQLANVKVDPPTNYNLLSHMLANYDKLLTKVVGVQCLYKLEITCIRQILRARVSKLKILGQ